MIAHFGCVYVPKTRHLVVYLYALKTTLFFPKLFNDFDNVKMQKIQ